MNAAVYLLLLILPLSALISRRLPIASLAKMVLGWIAIFAVLAILVGQRERFRGLWDGAVAAVGGVDQIVTGQAVRIPMSGDGHFWATVRLNGVTVRMLIDSGATTTAISAATAESAGIKVDPNAFGAAIDTANGPLVAATAQIDRLQIGGITAHDLPVLVAKEFGDTDVIGMNFLSRLGGWRVEGRTLILQPKDK